AHVAIAEHLRPPIEVLLNVIKGGGNILDKLAAGHGGLGLVILIAPADKDSIGRHIARADLHADGNAVLDPAPDLVAATHVARVDLHLNAPAVIWNHAQIIRKLVAIVHHR